MKRDYICRLRLLIDKLPLFFRESYFLFKIAKFLFNLPEELFTFRENYWNGTIQDLSKLYHPNNNLNLKRISKKIDINSFHLDLIKDYINFINPKNIMDVGCGNGFLFKFLDKSLIRCKLEGIDFFSPKSFIQ